MNCILRMGILFAAAFFLLGVVGVVQAQKQTNQPARNALVQPELRTLNDFQQMVRRMLPGLRKGFDMAGAVDLFDGFVSRVEQADIKIVEVVPEKNLLWMMFVEGQNVDLIKNVVRAGKEPFMAFVVTVEKDANLHVFVVPAMCGNLGLARIVALPLSVPVGMNSAQAKPPVAATPTVGKSTGPSTSGGEKGYKSAVPADNLNGRDS